MPARPNTFVTSSSRKLSRIGKMKIQGNTTEREASPPWRKNNSDLSFQTCSSSRLWKLISPILNMDFKGPFWRQSTIPALLLGNTPANCSTRSSPMCCIMSIVSVFVLVNGSNPNELPTATHRRRCNTAPAPTASGRASFHTAPPHL